jgi:Bacterial pre-peptidase C-terminal domain
MSLEKKILSLSVVVLLITSTIAFANTNKPVSLYEKRALYTTVSQEATFEVTGTQTIATQGSCSHVSVTVSGWAEATTDDGGGFDVITFELWDDGEVKDSKDISVAVGTCQFFSITMSFEGLYMTEASGVGVYASELDWKVDPFIPTDIEGRCVNVGFLPAIYSLLNQQKDIKLTNESEVSGTVAKEKWNYYYLEAKSTDTRVSFDLTHLSEDVDLYVRRGAKPTLSKYDCRPFPDKTWSEACSKANDGNNIWYVGVYGSKNIGENGNVKGSYTLKTFTGNIEGWSSVTGFRKADNNVREAIVGAAIATSGQSSGQSSQFEGESDTGSWLTDIAYDDGERMRNAINVYDDWYKNEVPYQDYNEDEIKLEMETAFSDSDYQNAQKTALVERIIAQYNVPVPSNEEETLQYLGIRRQCLEWAMTVAYSAGGNYVGYSASSVESKKVRPGMGLYNGRSHAMIIIDVYNDVNGNPTTLKVAESNYASDWVNPEGQIPWGRTIKTGREVSLNLGYTIVNYGEHISD